MSQGGDFDAAFLGVVKTFQSEAAALRLEAAAARKELEATLYTGPQAIAPRIQAVEHDVRLLRTIVFGAVAVALAALASALIGLVVLRPSVAVSGSKVEIELRRQEAPDGLGAVGAPGAPQKQSLVPGGLVDVAADVGALVTPTTTPPPAPPPRRPTAPRGRSASRR